MKVLLLYISLTCCLPALCQEYNYIHYDTKDGLPSSTVYWICQDKKGYLWLATDNGISMFDGKKFTNFTTENGLTDNEVLNVNTDSAGRIWMTPFDKTIAYYYQGKIYTAQNDTTLKIPSSASYTSIAGENEKGEIFFTRHEGILLKKPGRFKVIADYEKLARQYSIPRSDFIPMQLPKIYPYNLLLFNGPLVFISRNDTMVYLKTVASNITNRYDRYNIDKDLKIHYIPKTKGLENHKTVTTVGNYRFINTINGSWRVDSLGNIDPVPFLPGKTITHSFLDNEGNIWFSTLGEGVFRLTSESVRTFASTNGAFCIEKKEGRIHAGLIDGSLVTIKGSRIEKTDPFHPAFGLPSSRRLYTIKAGSSGDLYMGYDVYLAKRSKDRVIYSPLSPIKSIDIIDKDYIVVCTNAVTLKVRSADLKITDTIWKERGTRVIYHKGSYYIGTLSGMVIVGPDKTITRTAEHIPLLRRRIVDICKGTDNSIWIASNNTGVLLYKNGRADSVITLHKGLSSNTCTSLFLKGQHLWIGTNKGINKVDLTTQKVVARYGTADGLPSDIINAIYVDDSIIWIGTSEGLTCFKEKDVTATSICNLDLHSAHVSGKKVNLQQPLSLSYQNNNISFDYAAISFQSAGDITYYYKLNGLDDGWKQTRLTTLSYPSLPPGDYTLQLYAVNKFGKQSDTTTVQFHIAAPLWKTVWFWLASLALAAGASWLLVNRRYKQLQNRTKEKNELQRQMKELEHAALRAQMNPHFIFNCLNSIQAFIIKNDIEQTNKYITRFGHLIRQTLDNSGKEKISLADELAYLTNYIELEQMRSSSRFQSIVTIDPAIDTDHIFIPSMLLQPFIENAIRHGIRNKKNGEGTIKLEALQTADAILFSVEDNGIGREAAGKYKALQRIEYQSKGMALTQNRIEVLNSVNTEKITTAVTDIMDQDGHIAGTKVIISFPRSVVENRNQ